VERIKAVVREYYVLIGIIIGALVLYYPKLSLFFLSDDFVFLETFQKAEGIFKGVGGYHFNPVTQVLFYIMTKTFGLNPIPYHAITLFFHLINTTLVFLLANKLFKNAWTAALSSILFTTYFMNYEVVYWITGIYYMLLTLFYLLTILVFIKFLENKQRLYYVLFLIFFTGAIFAMEQGVTLIVPCILYELIMHARLKEMSRFGVRSMVGYAVRGSQKYILPIMILIFFFAIKMSLQQTFIISDVSWIMTIKVFIGMLWFLVLSFLDIFGFILNVSYFTDINSEYFYRALGFIVFTINKYYVYFIVLLIVSSFLCYYSSARKNLYLVGCILGYVIPLSISANMQARYFYLPSVFASIILANFVVWSTISIINSKKHVKTKNILALILIVIITVSIPVNITALKESYKDWNAASQITRNILQDTGRYISGETSPNIYFVNLPDALYNNKATWPALSTRAYIFRNGIGSAIKLLYPQKNIRQVVPVRTRNPGNMVTWEGHRFVLDWELMEIINDGDNMVFIYDPSLHTIKRMARLGIEIPGKK
jgi:hypothetical protein